MTFLRRLLIGLRHLMRPGDRDLEDELSIYLEAAVEDKVATGMTRKEALRLAQLEMGGVQQTKERAQEIGWESWVETLWGDVRLAARSLRRTPVFTITVIVTLALGIGANTAIFALMDAIMLRPLSVRNPGELSLLYDVGPVGAGDSQGSDTTSDGFPWPLIERFQDALPSGTSLAAMTAGTNLNARLGNEPVTTLVQSQLVSGEFFSTLGVRPAIGRVLTDEDMDVSTNAPAAVLGYGFWQRQFGGSPDVLGRTLPVNGVLFTIVGVAESGFRGLWMDSSVDLWVPLTTQPMIGYRQNASTHNADDDEPWPMQMNVSWLNVIIRSQPEARDAVRSALSGLHHEAMREVVGDHRDAEMQRLLLRRLEIQSFARGYSNLRDRYSAALRLLMGMVTVLLLIACTNIANLFLARWAARQREVATRLSIGAGRARLVRQLVTESLVVAALGATAGLLVAEWTSTALATSADVRDVLPAVVVLDRRVLGFCLVASFVTTLLCGVVPALRATATAPANWLRIGDTRSGRMTSVMRPLVGAQVALSIVLVVAATLVGRSLLNLWMLDPGFDHEHLVQIRMDPLAGGVKPDERAALYKRMTDRAQEIPGVLAAEVSRVGIASGRRSVGTFGDVEGYQPASGEVVRFMSNNVGPTYFATTGMTILRGRTFDERDTEDRPAVAVVNEAAAQRYFGGPQAAIGKHIGPEPGIEVVGVVRDAHVVSLRELPTPMVFTPILQVPAYAQALDIRVAGDPARIGEVVRRAIAADEPRLLADSRPRLIGEALDRGLSRDRLVAEIATAFGLLALALASIGLYGVLSYAVGQRTQEMGLRMALGARPFEVQRLVVAAGLRVVMAGIAVGVLAATATSQAMGSLLFGVTPLDGVAFVTGPILLLVISVIACAAPAFRASRVDPAVALRCD